jgi:glycosyltransferase involved in cell wall biosynthesis
LQVGEARPTVDVALVMPNFFGGGAERMMVRMARGLSELGHTVEIVVLADSGPFRKELGPKVAIIDLKSVHMRRSLGPLVRYLRSRRPATVLVTLEHAISAVLVARALSGVPVRVVARVATHLSARQPEGLLGQVSSLAGRLLLRQADAVIAVSRGVADDVVVWAKVPAEKVFPVYSPLVEDELNWLAGQDVEHPFMRGGGEPVLLAVGRLVKAKDYPTMLRALLLLRTKRPVRLVILGEGPERQQLEQFVGDHDLKNVVSLPGFVENPFAYMRQASVFALSSVREGLPGALVQAMACGCPVVSTDCPSGPREILDGGRLGELVPVGDASALAEAIERALDRPRDPEVLRRRAKEFSVSRAVARYEEILWP